MQEELNRTINILQRLTNKIVNLKQQFDTLLSEEDYNVLLAKLEELTNLVNNNINKNVKIHLNITTYMVQVHINNETYTVTSDMPTELLTTYPISFDFEPIPGAKIASKQIKIMDKDLNTIYLTDDPENETFNSLESGPSEITIYMTIQGEFVGMDPS